MGRSSLESSVFHDIGVFIAGALIGITAFIGCVVLWARWARWDERREKSKGEPVAMYCPGCGSALVTVAKQNGFDSKTGLPTYSHDRRCAKAGNYDRFCEFNRYAASNTLMDPQHNHPAGVSSVECWACLETMIKNGVLTPEKAEPLYRRLMTSKAS